MTLTCMRDRGWHRNRRYKYMKLSLCILYFKKLSDLEKLFSPQFHNSREA